MLPVLLIGAYFPPDGEVGGRRLLKLCEHLSALNVSPSVLTLPAPAASLDPFPESYLTGGKIHRVAAWPDPAPHIARVARLLAPRKQPWSAGGPMAGTAAGFSLRSQILAALYMPDAFIRWYWPARQAGSRICQCHATKVLISSGPPWTCHLIARSLRKKTGLPWIADFRDPWTSSASRGNQLPKWRLHKERTWEKACLAEADAVVCNTDQIRQRFAADNPQLPASKFVTITNGFEPTEHRQKPRDGVRRLILHLGSIYGARRIDVFCQALQVLIENGSIDRQDTRVVFLGDVEPHLIAAAERAAPTLFADKMVTFQSRLPWEEAQKLLWAADVHLIVQGKYTMQVPAKFFECLQTGSPILGIADEGALSEVIHATASGLWAKSDNLGQIADSLKRVLSMPPQSSEEVHRKTERFYWRSIATQFAEVIHSVSGASEECRT